MAGDGERPPVWLTGLPPEARGFQGRRAGMVSRTVAGIVDVVVVAALCGGAYLGLAGLKFVVNPVAFSFPAVPRAVLVPAGFAVSVFYLAVCWAATARTVGDELLGLRVLTGRGAPLRWGRAFLRALTYAVFPAGLLWVLFGASRRSLQDLVLHTVVVYDWNPRLPAKPD
ncbi:RDD family protein [Amycolatopsis acidicola]|uniref:RDD family protein n=1 Tax=Amycolatopsis acidicola TaxID=2596893 RepID=A0A5N0UPT1_9PSEU|nr:RDD family protein [Amycolatopsis acidicola]KAA9150314.1 RDD family protein [Amycolatopsis acidicola]